MAEVIILVIIGVFLVYNSVFISFSLQFKFLFILIYNPVSRVVFLVFNLSFFNYLDDLKVKIHNERKNLLIYPLKWFYLSSWFIIFGLFSGFNPVCNQVNHQCHYHGHDGNIIIVIGDQVQGESHPVQGIEKGHSITHLYKQ